MYDEQARINATISYFFLGPIFLLARPGSPLADTYVRIHSKRSSLILLIALIVYGIYYFIKPFLLINLFGISIASITLGSIATILIITLLYSAYRAFHGDTLSGTGSQDIRTHLDQVNIGEKTDAEKIRIIASFIPLLGIWISSKYNDPTLLLGRKVGTFLFVVIISSSLFLEGSMGLSLILTLLSIMLIAFSGVSLFMNNQLPIFRIYDWIPTYRELSAHIRGSITWIGGFFRILGGSEQEKKYREIYNEKYHDDSIVPYNEKFPLWIGFISFPVLNILTFPFLFQEKYREYRSNIIEGLTLTLLFVIVWVFFSWESGVQAYLAIPLVHLFSFVPLSQVCRAPGVYIFAGIFELFYISKERLSELQGKNEGISYEYKSEGEKQ